MGTFTIGRIFLALLVVASAAPPAVESAQRAFPKNQSYAAIGNGKFEIEDCAGKTVELSGDRQTITLLGVCKSIVARGSHIRLTIDGASSLRIIGNANVVKWKVRPGSVVSSGRGNILIPS